MLIARISNVPRDEMLVLLQDIGRLISYTRQLDALLRTDDDVEWFVRSFVQRQYSPDRYAAKEGGKTAASLSENPLDSKDSA
jgi:hypothetical protein